jgi:two-component SAPR family response regulator
MDDYLEKPVQMERLDAVLSRVSSAEPSGHLSSGTSSDFAIGV